jgi:hypothetical protein
MERLLSHIILKSMEEQKPNLIAMNYGQHIDLAKGNSTWDLLRYLL